MPAHRRHNGLVTYQTKSHVLIFGEDSCPSFQLHLGDQVLPVLSVDKHLGVPLIADRTPSLDILNESVSRGRRSFHASMSLGNKYHTVPPLTLSKLYWSISIPQMTYGMELLSLSASMEHKLEITHMSVAKVIQGLPKQTSSPAVLPPLQWMTIHSILAYKRLTLLWRILLLPVGSICKQLVMSRVLEFIRRGFDSAPHGPVRVIVESAMEYRLCELISQSITNAHYMSIDRWKKLVQARIGEVQHATFEARTIMYSKLIMYKQCLDPSSIWPWWVHAQSCPQDGQYCRTMIRLMVGEHELQSNGRHASRVCQLCDLYVVEDVPHMLFVCPSLRITRIWMWREIENIAPAGLLNEMYDMLPSRLCVFWFSGFKCKYVHEWLDLYSRICSVIHTMYKKRLHL